MQRRDHASLSQLRRALRGFSSAPQKHHPTPLSGEGLPPFLVLQVCWSAGRREWMYTWSRSVCVLGRYLSCWKNCSRFLSEIFGRWCANVGNAPSSDSCPICKARFKLQQRPYFDSPLMFPWWESFHHKSFTKVPMISWAQKHLSAISLRDVLLRSHTYSHSPARTGGLSCQLRGSFIYKERSPSCLRKTFFLCLFIPFSFFFDIY